MQFLIFILVYPIVWCLSILPMKILYFISDIIYVILYYVIGYRKKIVRNNLKLAFPEKSKNELLSIEKKAFHHFVDIFIEMIKSFTISNKEVSKRFVLKNIELIEDFYKNKKCIIIMAGHYANWEWAVYVINQVKYTGYAAYKIVNNKYFDKKIKETRSKFGLKVIPTSNFIKVMVENQQKNKLGIYGLLSDQSPLLKKTHYWSKFMNINVPFHTGAEMLAKKFDYPVIFLKTKRIKRGYYESSIKVLTNTPREFEDYKITDLFIKELEDQIKEKPEFYFWTHKRFKHMGKESYENSGLIKNIN